MRKKIKSMQRAPEKTKKIWVGVLSAISIALTIGLSIVYFNLVLPSPSTIAKKEAAPAKEKSGFFQIMNRGFKTILKEAQIKTQDLKNDFEKNLANLKSQVERVNKFSFEGADNNKFFPAKIEEVPKTKL